MSTPTKHRLPVSAVNAVLVTVFLAGAVASAIGRSWLAAIGLAAIGIFGLIAALAARRPAASDLARVNAIEYRDERDQRIAQFGFTAVGVAALILTTVQFVVAMILAQTADSPQIPVTASVQLLVLCGVWGVANRIAAGRF